MYMEFNHNFCESRINNYNTPEIWNSYSSLAISIIPLLFRSPNSDLLLNIKYLLIFNGISSFIYHYYLTWLGKQLDELSMILTNYFGLSFLLNVFFTNNIYSKYQVNLTKQIHIYFTILFMTINTFPSLDFLFPNIFFLYLIPTIYLIYKISFLYNISIVKINHSLAISLVGGISWLISENFCNDITKYGHVIWHLLFPLGFYKIVEFFDKKFST